MAAIGEDSSGQEMKKKHAVGKDRRRGGHEVPRGFEPRSNNRKVRGSSPRGTTMVMCIFVYVPLL